VDVARVAACAVDRFSREQMLGFLDVGVGRKGFMDRCDRWCILDIIVFVLFLHTKHNT
jgi:hypothetical protein